MKKRILSLAFAAALTLSLSSCRETRKESDDVNCVKPEKKLPKIWKKQEKT